VGLSTLSCLRAHPRPRVPGLAQISGKKQNPCPADRHPFFRLPSLSDDQAEASSGGDDKELRLACTHKPSAVARAQGSAHHESDPSAHGPPANSQGGDRSPSSDDHPGHRRLGSTGQAREQDGHTGPQDEPSDYGVQPSKPPRPAGPTLDIHGERFDKRAHVRDQFTLSRALKNFAQRPHGEIAS